MTAEQPVLQFDDVSLSYGRAPVVRDASFSVAPGSIVGLVGESGSGKTTLLRAALGVWEGGLRLAGGSIRFLGEDVASMGERRLRELRSSQASMVFQDSASSFCPVRRVGPQVWDAMRGRPGLTHRECDERFYEILQTLGLRDSATILRAYPHELSGGMAQRVGIALALMSSPRIILADEPTSALDVATQAQVVQALRDARERFGCAILLVTHNFRLVERLCDHAVVLHQGRVVEQGPIAQVLANPQDAYTRNLIAAAPRLRRPDNE